MRISDWSSDVCSSDLFERRRSLRFILPHQEDITLIVDGKPYRGKLEDVSIGGAKLRMETAVPQSDDVRLEHAVAGPIEDVSLWLRGDTIGSPFALSDPALELISLFLTQALPGGTFPAGPRSTSYLPYPTQRRRV